MLRVKETSSVVRDVLLGYLVFLVGRVLYGLSVTVVYAPSPQDA